MRSKVICSLNALLWGCKSWNLTKSNLCKLAVFHHGAIPWILRIKWSQVREQHIKSKSTYPQKFLAAWINDTKKPVTPQLTCNNNFVNALKKILPADVIISKQHLYVSGSL
jgi:hypothetical protein